MSLYIEPGSDKEFWLRQNICEAQPTLDTVIASLLEVRKALLKEGEMLWMQKDKSPEYEKRMDEIAEIVKHTNENISYLRKLQPQESDSKLKTA